MRPNQGLNFSRKIVTANKEWTCDALCGLVIKAQEDYVLDAVFDGVASSANLRFHLRCAEPDRRASKGTALKYFHEIGAKR